MEGSKASVVSELQWGGKWGGAAFPHLLTVRVVFAEGLRLLRGAGQACKWLGLGNLSC